MKDYVCVMPFLDESASFVHGWECGTIWQRMTNGEAFDYQPVHAVNRNQIAMIAQHFGYEYTFTEMDEEWIGFTSKPVDISGITY